MTTANWISITILIIQLLAAWALAYWQVKTMREISKIAHKVPKQKQFQLSKWLKHAFLNEPFLFLAGQIFIVIMNTLYIRKLVGSSEPLTREAVFYICFYMFVTAFWANTMLNSLVKYVQHWKKYGG